MIFIVYVLEKMASLFGDNEKYFWIGMNWLWMLFFISIPATILYVIIKLITHTHG
jgi:hypothetical protein